MLRAMVSPAFKNAGVMVVILVGGTSNSVASPQTAPTAMQARIVTVSCLPISGAVYSPAFGSTGVRVPSDGGLTDHTMSWKWVSGGDTTATNWARSPDK